VLRLSVRTIDKGESVVAFVALLGFVVILQILGGAYASGFGGYPDEPAHLVTSLMARDFIAGLDFRHPVQFAQQFYYHYPEVAIGHWPPAFYGALGTWFLLVGASRGSAMMFIAFVAATTASVIYFTGKRLIGRWAGVLAAVLFIASPLVQEASARVMSEHLVTLGMLVSTLCFARFATTERISDGLAFGIIAAVAILTHPDAWALGLVPGITIALTDRWDLLRRPGLWLAAVPVLAVCVPWYALTLGMAEDGLIAGGPLLSLAQAVGFGRAIYNALGFAVLLLAVVGLWTTIVKVERRSGIAPEWAALAGLAMATFALHSIIPTGAESRYMVTVLPSLVLFSAAGVHEIVRRLGDRQPLVAVRVGVTGALLVVFGAQSFALPLQLRNQGYGALVREVEARVSQVPQVWLISSDATGEGCLVATVALQEARPGSYVLRGKTLLAGGSWLGNNEWDRFDTPAKLAKLLDDLHVTLIVIDDSVAPKDQRPYRLRLKKLVASDRKTWELTGSYPQMKAGIALPNSLHVYTRRPVASFLLSAPAFPLDRLKALMIRKQLR
jgi:Dolichyl-phosphate-mannose-protein mannosyltransferase